MFWLNALVNQRGHDCQCFLADSAFEEVADGEKLIEGIAQIVVAVSARTRQLVHCYVSNYLVMRQCIWTIIFTYCLIIEIQLASFRALMGSVSPLSSAPQHLVTYRHKQKSTRDRWQEQITAFDREIIRNMCKKHSVFSQAAPDDILLMVSSFKKMRATKGAYIYRQHDKSESAYLILEGRLAVEIDCSLSKILGSYEYFGHDSLTYDASQNESIRVVTDEATLYWMSRADFQLISNSIMQRLQDEINDVFSKVHFFNYLTNKERRFLVANTYLLCLHKEESIFEQGQEANSFYIIRRGKVGIAIPGKKQLQLTHNDCFGESAFMTLLHPNSLTKSLRVGRAFALEEQTELFTLGLTAVKKCAGNYVRSVIFFNHQKWALYRDQNLAEMATKQFIDYHALLRLFNVKSADKYSILARRNTRLQYLFIPMESEPNKQTSSQLLGSEYLRPENEDLLLGDDIVLTAGGFYAYASIDLFRDILHKSARKNQRLQQPSLCEQMVLTLKNISKYAKQLSSSKYLRVLLVQDLKFGNEFIVKAYPRQECPTTKNLSISSIGQLEKVVSCRTIACSNQEENDSSQQMVAEDKIRQEKDILESLDSRFICGYYKCQKDKRNFYIFTQYIRGTSLYHVLREFGRLPETLCKYYMASLSCALEDMHSMGIVHRDLKPENAIVRNTGELVLVDLACAKKIGKEGRTSTVLGSPHYMAPEVIKGKQYTLSVDYWALGVILYEFVSGKLPFGNDLEDTYAIFEKILEKPVVYQNSISQQARTLLSLLLEKDGENRIRSQKQLREAEYLNDIEFKWQEFLVSKLDPPFFPQRYHINYCNISSNDIVDPKTLTEWS